MSSKKIIDQVDKFMNALPKDARCIVAVVRPGSTDMQLCTQGSTWEIGMLAGAVLFKLPRTYPATEHAEYSQGLLTGMARAAEEGVKFTDYAAQNK